MQKDHLESLLSEAKLLEKKYEWLQAAGIYDRAIDFVSKETSSLKVAETNEQIGYCYYRAALQAATNNDFRKRIELSVHAYEEAIRIFEFEEQDNQTRTNHAKALLAFSQSWLETDPQQKKELLLKWWTLENQVLKERESSGDLLSVGRTYNDLIEYSGYDLWWLAYSYSESEKIFKKSVEMAEKAIQIFSELDDRYELARAYCSASWYYSFSDWYFEDENEITQLGKKCQEYANIGLSLSEEIGDARLISRAYNSAWGAAQILLFEPSLAIELSENMLKYGTIAKDNYLIGFGNCLTSFSMNYLARLQEDPDKQKESFEKSKKMALQATRNFTIINQIVGFYLSYPYHSQAILGLASIETNPDLRKALLENANKVCREGLERVRGWKRLIVTSFHTLSLNLYLLSEIKKDMGEKRKLLNESAVYERKAVALRSEFMPFGGIHSSSGIYQLVLAQDGLAKIESDRNKKVELFKQAVISVKDSIRQVQKRQKFLQSKWTSGFLFGRFYFKLGEISKNLYFLLKDNSEISNAVEAYEKSSVYYSKAEISSRVAESYWNIAKLQDISGQYQEAADNYRLASEAYEVSAKQLPQLKDFYSDYSSYMQAWNRIEQVKYSHFNEDYDKARQQYENAAELHESTESWSYLSSNYFAWAKMEEAEGLSRGEQTQKAKDVFQKALEQFMKAEEAIKQKIGEITSAEEKELTLRLLKASDLRRRFCQARIQIEEAKLFDRLGGYLQSSKNYLKAANEIESIVEKVDSEAEQKELELLATLCHAWQKMATAEETTSSESYLEAAELFEKAKEYCYTKKASLWMLGNSSFCKGLAAKSKFQSTFNKSYHSMANKHVEQAADYYRRAGFQAASEYAKATQRLLDAYVYMNSAQEEADPGKKTKFYQLAEQLLQIAAGSFMKAKQPEKTSQVQQIIITVREEKALAVSLNEVMRAPTITSSTMSFTAPSPTSEVSVGLEHFQHANVQANLVAGLREVKVGESFCLSVEFVNAGKEPALLTRVEDFVPPEFIVVQKPEIYRLEDRCLNMKGKQIAPLKLVEAKLVLQPSKKGVYHLKPTVHYLDELGQNKSLQLKSVQIKVAEVVFEDRISTGTKELDSLLLGGIPKEYAVVLTGSPSDERELIIKDFLEAGTREGQTSFYVTTEADNVENLIDKPGFYLFLCNPKPKVDVPDLPNVSRLRSKTDLTNLNIALLKAYRNVEQSSSKRACINIISDVLVDHGIKTTRKWVAELTTDFVSKGFTVLAVMNPGMHPLDQATGVIDLFDGEISITQTDDPQECKKSIQVKKLRGQDYIKNPICLTKH